MCQQSGEVVNNINRVMRVSAASVWSGEGVRSINRVERVAATSIE